MDPDFSLAVLFDEGDPMPPSSINTLTHLANVSRGLGIQVRFVDDGLRLDEFDGLFIRQTTSVHNWTFRAACRARYLSVPAIDDYVSILTCCDKIAMLALLREAGIPVPRGVIIQPGMIDGDVLPWILNLGPGPYVVKVPDSSFGRGMIKVERAREVFWRATTNGLRTLSSRLLVQPFIESPFDWRIGVLNGEPLFACQYFFAKDHWQIIKHLSGGRRREGEHRTVSVTDVPPLVLINAVNAARAVGSGLYGVDLKENSSGDVVVMEVNDNPNIEQGVEYPVGDDEVWTRILTWFRERRRAEDRS